jgi:hypothetical protein
MTDPIFKYVIKDSLYKIFCCLCKKKKKLQKSETLKEMEALLDKYSNTNSFLFSSLNMEIVYSILEGISKVVRDLDPNKE